MMSRMFSEATSDSMLFSICKGKDSRDYKGKSVVFEPQYHGGSTMLKLYGTHLYVGCDRKGFTTLRKNVDQNHPSPETLFHAEKVR